MPWVYQRPPGHVVEGVLSLKCPVCGNVAPAAKMAARMRRAGHDQTIALWQKPGGRGKMSRAARLSVVQLQDFARRGDIRATAALSGLRYALAALLWLNVLRGAVPSAEMERWAATAAHDVGAPVHVRAHVDLSAVPAAPIALRAVNVGVPMRVRAKVLA